MDTELTLAAAQNLARRAILVACQTAQLWNDSRRGSGSRYGSLPISVSERFQQSLAGLAYPWTFRSRRCKRRTFALLGRFGRLLHNLFSVRPYIQVGILSPADTAVVTENVSGESKGLGRLPPCIGFTCPACATAVVCPCELCDDRALVI